MVSFGRTNYLPAKNISVSANPFVAGQIEEFSKLADMGTRNVEIGTLRFTQGGPQNAGFESISKDQWRHIRALGEVIGVEPTLHAPIQDGDPAGFSPEGRWSEERRAQQERNLEQVVEAGITLTNDKPMKITLHSANIAGSGGDVWTKDISGKERVEVINVIDPINKNVQQLSAESVRFRLGKKAEEVDPANLKRLVELANDEQWDRRTRGITSAVSNLRIIQSNTDVRAREAKALSEALGEEIPPELKGIEADVKGREAEVDIARENIMEDLRVMSGMMKKSLDWEAPSKELKILYGPGAYQRQRERFLRLKERVSEFENIVENGAGNKESRIGNAVEFLRDLKERPSFLFPVQDIHIRAATDTIANVAVRGWEMARKEGKPAPMISVENPPAGFGPGSRAEDLLNMLKISREKAAESLVKNHNIGWNEAREAAKQLIGHTIDPGHLWTHTSRGFTKEDILAEIGKLSKQVTHIHLNDNFGNEDAHTILGSGTVPNKETLEILRKAGNLDKIIGVYEVGSAIGTGEDINPVRTALEQFDSTISIEGEPERTFLDISLTADAYVLGTSGVSPFFAPYGRQHAQAYGTPGLVPGVSRNFLLGYREGGAPRTGGAGFGTPNV